MKRLQIFNTMTQQAEEVVARDNTFTLYTCGPTVYNTPHIGNWFTFVRYDILIRALQSNGFTVHHVENITDVGHLSSDADEGEDKIEKGARREGITAWEVAKRYTDEFITGSNALNILPPTVLAKATDHIPQQIALVQVLEAKGVTYIIDDGVYFDTQKIPDYGKLARLNVDQLQAGARIEMNDQKRHHSDFALWKFSPKNQKRDMEWNSPWGKGFPGWHLECSAMAMEYLGETIDLHAGGIDHIPVHHTNEIAQSETATGRQFAHYWWHAHHLLSNGQKISKSLGNGYTLEDIAAHGFDSLDLRMLILQSHYRSDANFNWETLQAARQRHLSLQAIADLRFQTINFREPLGPERFATTLDVILAAINNDLNTPEVLATLSQFETVIEQELIHKDELADFIAFLEKIDALLGLQLLQSQDITDQQKTLITKRQEARSSKDFVRADELRGELAEQSIGLRDFGRTTVWHRL